MRKNNKKITILGGGITGLMCAYFAARDGWEVTVLEGSNVLGGLLNTFKIAGSQLEFYYHHFFTHDAEIQWLCKELGIEDKMYFSKGTMAFYKDGHSYKFNSVVDLLKFSPLSFIDKIRFSFSSFYLARFADWRKLENISAMEWFYKYAGKNVTDVIWKPMLEVKFGPYAKKVPIAWMVGRLAQRVNSRKGTEEKLGYLEGSLQVLLNALIKDLKRRKVKLITHTQVQKCFIRNNTCRGLKTTKGNYMGGVFISTIPTFHLASLIKDEVPKYAKALNKIKYFGVVCTVFELKRKLTNAYWTSIADAGYPFGVVVEHTNLISPQKYNGSHIVYVGRYFALQDSISRLTTDEMKKYMIKGFKKMFPLLKDSDIKNVYCFRSNTAATVCDLNFSKKVPNCKSPIVNLYNISMPHIYPDERSTNNSIRIASEGCKLIGIDTSMVPYGASLSGKIGMS